MPCILLVSVLVERFSGLSCLGSRRILEDKVHVQGYFGSCLGQQDNRVPEVALLPVSRIYRRSLQIPEIQREDAEARCACLRLRHSVIDSGSLRPC